MQRFYCLQNMATRPRGTGVMPGTQKGRRCWWTPEWGQQPNLRPLLQAPSHWAPLVAKGCYSACSLGLPPARGSQACGNLRQKGIRDEVGSTAPGLQGPGQGPVGPSLKLRPSHLTPNCPPSGGRPWERTLEGKKGRGPGLNLLLPEWLSRRSRCDPPID